MIKEERMLNDLEFYVNSKSTYKLRGWHTLSQVFVLASTFWFAVALFCNDHAINGAAPAALFVASLLTSIVCLSRYTKEWRRIADTHPILQ